jgi:hypothetical protein
MTYALILVATLASVIAVCAIAIWIDEPKAGGIDRFGSEQ